jgi:hypothetical protein
VLPVKYELNLYIFKVEVDRLWSRGQSSWLQNLDVLFLVSYKLNLYYVNE